MRLREEVQRLVVELHNWSKICLVTNIARISPYVLLMTEFQRVIDFTVSDHVLRDHSGSSRHNQELKTRQAINCVHDFHN